MNRILLLIIVSATIPFTTAFVREETRADLPISALASAERLTDSECLEVVDSTARNVFEKIVKLSCENRILKRDYTSGNWLQYVFTALAVVFTVGFYSKKSIAPRANLYAPSKFVCTTTEEVQIEGEITKQAETSGEEKKTSLKLFNCETSRKELEEMESSIEDRKTEYESEEESEEKEFEISVRPELQSSFIKTSIFDQYDFVHCVGKGRPRCYSDPRDRRLFVVDPVEMKIGEISPEMSEGVQMDDSEDNSEGEKDESGSIPSKDESQFDKFEEIDFPEEPETEVFCHPQTEEPGMNMDISLETKINERKPMVFVGGIAASTTPLELVQEFKGQGFNVTVVPRIRYGVSFGFCPDLVLSNEDEKNRLLSMGRVWVKDRWIDIRQYIPKDEQSQQSATQIEAVSSSVCTNSENYVQELAPPMFIPDHSPPGFPSSTASSNPTSPFVPCPMPMFFSNFGPPVQYYGPQPDYHPVMAQQYYGHQDTFQQYSSFS